jgi:predicted acylesterase/phospholipase RssA
MRRMRSSLPWGTVVLFSALFLLAWWIEDCLLYSVSTGLQPGRMARTAVDTIGLTFLWTVLGQVIGAVAHLIAAMVSFVVTAIADGFDAIPPAWRETPPLRLLARAGNSFVATYSGASLLGLGAGLGLTAGFLLRGLIALNGAGWLYNLLRRFSRYLDTAVSAPLTLFSSGPPLVEPAPPQLRVPDELPPPPPPQRPPTNGKTTKLQRRQEYQQFFDTHIQRIGIVLGGGGAKGAYQAGALKAIYEFLRGYNALDKVKMITGTSIGAWNAMFWLGGMMESADGAKPAIESWWKSISFGSLLEFPWLLMPFFSNSILRMAPWRENFLELFGKRFERFFGTGIHFYLTRADMKEGVVSYVTNRQDIGRRLGELGVDRNDDYRFFQVIDRQTGTAEDLADAVFSSMSLPPLCTVNEKNGSAYEDASLNDGPPLRFASPLEECDLVFVLPLDGKAVPEGGTRPMMRRLLHRMDSGRRALSHAVLKNVDFINHQSDRIERMDFGINALAQRIKTEGIAEELLLGLREEIEEFNQECRRLYVFTISPFGRLELGDLGLWRRHEAADAFDLMYVQTRRELMARFFEDIEPEDAHVVMVDGLAPRGDDLPQPKYRSPSQW